jgi:hypothetical protein
MTLYGTVTRIYSIFISQSLLQGEPHPGDNGGEFPFTGDIRVHPDALELVLHEIERDTDM